MGGVALIVFNLSCVCVLIIFYAVLHVKEFSLYVVSLSVPPPPASVCVCVRVNICCLLFHFLVCRYPNTACELLTSDVSQINDKLASDRELVDQLYSFLESERPLNPLLASFFSKVMGLLITRKSEMVRFSVLGSVQIIVV